MPSGFIYKSGPHDFKNRATTASTAIARGDALYSSSGRVLPLATGSKCVGIAQEVKAVGDAATTAIQVLKVHYGRTLFNAYEKRSSGSLAATDQTQLRDVSGASAAMGFDSSATTNLDIYIDTVLATGASNTGRALIAFADPSSIHGQN